MPSPWGRWRGAVLWHCTVTDEGSPLKAGLTAVRTTDIEIKESRLTAGFFISVIYGGKPAEKIRYFATQ